MHYLYKVPYTLKIMLNPASDTILPFTALMYFTSSLLVLSVFELTCCRASLRGLTLGGISNCREMFKKLDSFGFSLSKITLKAFSVVSCITYCIYLCLDTWKNKGILNFQNVIFLRLPLRKHFLMTDEGQTWRTLLAVRAGRYG